MLIDGYDEDGHRLPYARLALTEADDSDLVEVVATEGALRSSTVLVKRDELIGLVRNLEVR